MAERGTEDIQREMEVERNRLEEAREALQAELRSFVPVVVVGAVAIGITTARYGLRAGIRTIRKLSA